MASDVSTSRKQFWEEHIAQWRATALSQGEYCRRNKISLKSFQYWKGKAKRGSALCAISSLSKFVKPKTICEIPES